jgi:hypothetical protein
VLRGYFVNPAGQWTPYSLATSGWADFTQVVSPGNGLYYARTSTGGLQRYTDAAPFDGSGSDITAYANDPVDTSGWNQKVLSAVPLRSFPQNVADASVFGVDDNNHLTYTAAETGGRPIAAVTSEAALPFTARAIASLNYNTVLITSTTNHLFRVDVNTTLPVLTFATPVQVDSNGGWTHDLLAYDGAGSLYGIAGNGLRRYTITSAKPTAADITANTLIGTGFTLKTLTTAGRGWILGTVSDGRLMSYQIVGAGDWVPYTLATTGWGGYNRLVSPGNGLYYAVAADGIVTPYRDAAPFDGKGTDISTGVTTPENAPKWSPRLVSAVPFIS